MTDTDTPSLQNLQSQFSGYVMFGEQDIKDSIVSTDSLSSDVRIAIYANAYVARLIEALETDYPTLKSILGDDAFNALAEIYIHKYPSTHPSLRWFGSHLSDLLSTLPDYAEKGYLQEIAVLEWSLTTAFDSADDSIIKEGDVALVPPEQWPNLTLQFHPSVQLFQYHWNILSLWNAVTEEKPIPTAIKLSESETCLVWREELNTHFRTLSAEETTTLTLMLEGENFSELCELIASKSSEPEQVPVIAAGYLKSWIVSEMVCGLSYSD